MVSRLLILVALLSATTSALAPTPKGQSHHDYVQHIGDDNLPPIGKADLPIRPKPSGTESLGSGDLNGISAQGKEATVDDMAHMRTAISTRTITLIIATADSNPQLSTDFDPAELKYARNEDRHINIIQLPPGRKGNDNGKAEMPSHNLRSAHLRRANNIVGKQYDISDGAIWFFLVSFGVFMTGVVWNVYVHIGMEREERLVQDLAMSDRELGKGRVTTDGATNNAELARVVPTVQLEPRSFG